MKQKLERLYSHYNSREWVHPDPIEAIYPYPDVRDREIAALVASSLAYGRASQIVKSVYSVLPEMGSSPYLWLKDATRSRLEKVFGLFKHRFSTGEELVCLLTGIRRVISRYGSLNNCFLKDLEPKDETVLPALSHFVNKLDVSDHGRCNSLMPMPRRGSACKRLNLFLRWMVRSDRVDPGGWKGVGPRQLIVPLDTHMHRICLALGFTRRASGNMKTALEVTQRFREIMPSDPVRYDFALTRLGIRNDGHMKSLWRGQGMPGNRKAGV